MHRGRIETEKRADGVRSSGVFAVVSAVIGRVPARRYLLALAATSLAAMVAGVPAAQCFPWSIDMYRGAAIQPLSTAPRVMPKGTLPTDGLQKMSLEQMTVSMHNPFQPTPKNLAHGKKIFMTDCMPCHGKDGNGDGPVAHLLRHKPASLITGVSKNLPDGYIYGYIRNGGIWMPSYDDAMSSNERWDVVMYVRSMQKKAAEAKNGKVAAR